MRLALDAHGSQVDKSGRPYILHPFYVMQQVETEDEMTVAALHDTLEDNKEVTIGENRQGLKFRYNPKNSTGWYSFKPEVIEALDAITHREGESKEAYWGRVRANPLALRVKLADVGHNSSEARLAELIASDRIRLIRKYHLARDFFAENDGKAFVPFMHGKKFDHAKRILVNAGYDESFAWRLLIDNPHMTVCVDGRIEEAIPF